MLNSVKTGFNLRVLKIALWHKSILHAHKVCMNMVKNHG